MVEDAAPVGTIAVQVVTPEREVWSGAARMVIARGSEGYLGVLPHHAPLITALVDGPVRIHLPDGAPDLVFGVASGFLEVKPDRVTVLADAVGHAEGITPAEVGLAQARDGGA